VAVQNRGGGTLTSGPHGTVPVGRVKWRSIDFKINLNRFKQFQNRSNFDQLKNDHPELEKFEENMVLKGLKRGTTFSIGTSSDSEWISS
jgi:hypothetical protein